jgi:PAS domain S-box-containing protein
MRDLVRKDALASELRARDEQLRQMVQSVKDAIVTVSAAGCIVLFNRAAERMFGVRSEEALGSSFTDLISRCMSQTQLAGLMQHMDKGWAAPSGTDVLALIAL